MRFCIHNINKEEVEKDIRNIEINVNQMLINTYPSRYITTINYRMINAAFLSRYFWFWQVSLFNDFGIIIF